MVRNNPYRPKTFDPAQPLVVRRAFNGNGRHFKPGDPFEWDKLAIDRRRVRQLFDAGKVMHPQSLEPERKTAPDVRETPGVQVQAPDELDRITDMRELREIAEREGAKTTTSKTMQRRYIRENRQLERETRPEGDAPSNVQSSDE